ncbi:hypothetical protein [Paenibacillus sp. UASWS1643]|uniref:hypothetical protein n=1 Tax=Paenibacillus sp. UASWS1643 TaxID=2580422 RepID=UPI00123B38C2|nr:hypothetical protein [Paenibacillus sp. UASWS1643]KAA8750108.1 hypothetical protein FE296_16045 [Paenibacillus sp. UASWS1643]
MRKITLEAYEDAKRKYQMWSEAEDARSAGASYNISGRGVTYSSMEEIQMMKRRYRRIIDAYENGGKRRSRTSSLYPVDS